jgi:Zn-finger nucleic acid-binding protein
MTPETRAGVTVDKCDRCDGLWFDAAELDRWLGDAYTPDARPPESRIPARGLGSRPCPRCHCALDTAGWTGLVLDRCGTCRGLFVEAPEIIRMQHEGLPAETAAFETRFAEAMVQSGWNVLAAAGLARLILQVLARV